MLAKRKGRSAKKTGALRARPHLESLEDRIVPVGTWTALTNLAPEAIGTMMLLSDGTVMAEGNGQTNHWYNLTPDTSGSYTNGAWTSRASMRATRLYFASNILTDGRVFVEGGEYSSDGGFTRTGEIYNPVNNTWTNIANFPNSQFGDDPSELLPDGRVFAGYISGPATYIYDPATNTWAFAANKLRNDQSDEEAWLKLPDNSILSYDVFASASQGVGHAQRYVPSTNTWVDAGTPPALLSTSGVGFELGPNFLLSDGRVFQLGANNHTALYTPSTNTWVAGPDMPTGMGADDAPGAELPNGHILFTADHPLFGTPTRMFDFDPTPNTLTDITTTLPSALQSVLQSNPSYPGRMLVLPTGQVLFAPNSFSATQLYVYTPDGSASAAWKPTITGIEENADSTFTLTGTQLNGISEGANYGDDAEMSSNYPIVQITDDTGHIYYARTFNWSSTGVATGDTPVSTQFTLPSGVTLGQHYTLSVIANGIASDAIAFGEVAGPSVISSMLTGGVSVTTVRVSFDEAIDPSSFTSDQVVSFTRTVGSTTTDLLPTLTGITPVSGSNRQFDITFATHTALGTYRVVIGPNILDLSGHPMDQNHNGIPGENGIAPDGDQYAAQFTVVGAKITASTPTGNNTLPGSVSSIQVTFNESVDPTTFTPSAVVLLGPGGQQLTITGVAPLSGTNNTRFNISVPLTATGSYQLLVLPIIKDFLGNLMDQDGNGIGGEIPDDIYTAPFGIAGPKVTASTPTGNNTLPGSVSSIQVTFNEAMDPATFSPNQVSLTGPGGAISVTTVTPVAGSNNTRFNIFAPLTVTGSYHLVLSAHIRDAFGNEMDQNGNLITGEVPGDEYQASFGIAGPKITSATPNATSGPVFSVRVTFNEVMDVSTFTPLQIGSFTGPDGSTIPVAGVVPVVGSNATQFDIVFAPQTAAGTYTMVIGPDIHDLYGNAMDQNGNLITGEIPDDQYVAHFAVHGPTVVSTTLTGTVFANRTTARITFDRSMDVTTFTTDQFQITGPGGVDQPVTSVNVVTFTNNTQFDITFALTAGPGTYTLHVGPNLKDLYGNPMDAAFTGTFTVISTTTAADGFGYRGSVASSSGGSIVGQTGTFTVITSGDDVSNPVNLGTNTFNFYGTTYTGNNQLYASTNGLITFGVADTSYSNTNLTSSPSEPTIAVLWTDWVTTPIPGVVAQFADHDGNGTPHQLIIEWNQLHHYGLTGTVSLQAILSINTGAAPGDIVLNYLNLQSGDSFAEGNNSTVGIKANGTQGSNRLLINFLGTSPFVGTGQAVRFTVGATLRVTHATSEGVSLTWTSPGSATLAGYKIERSTDGTTFSQIAMTDASTNTFTDTDVQNGGTYYYRVRPFDAFGDLPYSNVDSVALGGSVDHSGGFADHSDLTANGSVIFTGTAAQLTSGAQGVFNQAGSIFSTSRVDVTSFVTSFTFQMTAGSDPVGNGITFTIQGSGPNALGPSGGGLGYGPDTPNTGVRGIRNSVAIKFKTVINVVGQETDNATGLFTDGRSPTVPEAGSGDVNVNLDASVIDLKSQDPFLVMMSYDGTTLHVTITDTATNLSAEQFYTVDIPGQVGSNVAYVGFTGATGGVHTAYLLIQDWTLTPASAGPGVVHPASAGVSSGAVGSAIGIDPLAIPSRNTGATDQLFVSHSPLGTPGDGGDAVLVANALSKLPFPPAGGDALQPGTPVSPSSSGGKVDPSFGRTRPDDSQVELSHSPRKKDSPAAVDSLFSLAGGGGAFN
jgi:hypothetical protein